MTRPSISTHPIHMKNLTTQHTLIILTIEQPAILSLTPSFLLSVIHVLTVNCYLKVSLHTRFTNFTFSSLGKTTHILILVRPSNSRLEGYNVMFLSLVQRQICWR